MKIALIIQNADRRNGGAEQYTLDLANSLTHRGHEVTVVAESGPAAVVQGAAQAGVRCIYLGSKGRLRWYRLQDFMLRVKDLYEGGAYDIVHSMMPLWRCDVYHPHSGFATDSWRNGHLKHPRWIVRRWARRFNRYNIKRRGLAQVEKEMMSHKPMVLCLSSRMMEIALEYFALPERNLVRLMNGIDLARFDPEIGTRARQAIREEWNVEKDQPLGLFIGNNWMRKGLVESIDVLAQVKDSPFVLMAVGRDDPELYVKQAEKLGVKEYMRFVGGVSDPRGLYGAGDFLLLPTRQDPCSLVVLEALAMGLPVITTRQNGACEVMENGRQGVIFERGDRGALLEAIRAVLNPEKRKEMAREALALRQTLSFDHHVGIVEDVYRRVLESRAGGKPQEKAK